MIALHNANVVGLIVVPLVLVLLFLLCKYLAMRLRLEDFVLANRETPASAAFGVAPQLAKHLLWCLNNCCQTLKLLEGVGGRDVGWGTALTATMSAVWWCEKGKETKSGR